MDSVTLLHYKKNEIAVAISFDYGSNHNRREIECASFQCAHLEIPHIIIPLKFIGQYFESSLLSGAQNIPEGSYDENNMSSTVVPFRNGIMIAVACGFAESRDLKHVMMANHGGDHSVYPDCRPEFVSAMNLAMEAGTYKKVSLVAPFTHLNKTEIAILGKELGVDFAHTYSCYKGGERHCGKCATCLERKNSFKEAGITDPTLYED